MCDHLSRLYGLFSYRAWHFLRCNVLHSFAAAVEVDAGIFALAFGDHLHFKTAFFAVEHIARDGILGVGVTHGWLLWVIFSRQRPGSCYDPAMGRAALFMPKAWRCGIQLP